MAMVVNETVKREYQLGLRALLAAKVPFVVGGAWAIDHYLPLGRLTLDLDLMIEPDQIDPAVQTLSRYGARLLGRDVLQVCLTLGGVEIDLVHHFAQGEYAVDRTWYQNALPGYVFDVATVFAAPAELIWSKAFIASRHRFDGADIVHLIRATRRTLDWNRLYLHLKPYPELLLAYLHLFEFCYPGERAMIPDWLWTTLLADLAAAPEPTVPGLCRGRLIDSTSFIFDVVRKGYRDVLQT